MTLKIESKLVENISVRTPQGDVIKLILDEDGEHSGRATVVLYDSIGSYYWSAMGKPIKEFIISTPTSYLIDKLFQTEAKLPDEDGNAFLQNIYNKYKAEIKSSFFAEDKNKREKNRDLLRYAFDYLKNGEVSTELLYHNENLSNLLSELISDEWYLMGLQPEKENHVYTYQKNGIELIKTALKQLETESIPA
jgi:hypothetical protein